MITRAHAAPGRTELLVTQADSILAMGALARSSARLTKVRTLGALPTVATPER
ncbi:MAG: hypothetical protein ACYCUD_10055 [Candidatus Dormibacteria bacterium]